MTNVNFRSFGPRYASAAGLTIVYGLALCALSEPVRAAAVIVNSSGFENPPFSLGNLNNQNSWHKISAGTGTATVESSISAPGGSQAVQVNRTANSDDFWTDHVSAVTPQRYLSVDWDMRVAQTAGDPFSQVGPFFGILSYDDHADANNPLLLGGFGIEATFGKVYYTVPAGLVATGTIATFDQWHHFRMVFDYSSKTYEVYFDNSPLATSSFNVSAATAFTDADITAIVSGNDPIDPSLTGTAYFDNFIVRSDTLLAGDYDQNGIVNTADYSLWKQNFGATVAAGSGADGNGNGKIDAADYTIWRDHLGASLIGGSGSGSLSSSVVPEPSALMLLLCGIVTAAFGCLPRLRQTPSARPAA